MTKDEIAEILKNARLVSKMTQQEAADAIGRPRQTLSSWEKAVAQPDINTLFLLFQIYGQSIEEAFGFNKKGFGTTLHEQRIIRAYRQEIGMQAVINKILGIEPVPSPAQLTPPVKERKYDQRMSGKIPYEKFRKDIIKKHPHRYAAKSKIGEGM
jgi:transcriptional regulator with XRE-family HTH domain